MPSASGSALAARSSASPLDGGACASPATSGRNAGTSHSARSTGAGATRSGQRAILRYSSTTRSLPAACASAASLHQRIPVHREDACAALGRLGRASARDPPRRAAAALAAFLPPALQSVHNLEM